MVLHGRWFQSEGLSWIWIIFWSFSLIQQRLQRVSLSYIHTGGDSRTRGVQFQRYVNEQMWSETWHNVSASIWQLPDRFFETYLILFYIPNLNHSQGASSVHKINLDFSLFESNFAFLSVYLLFILNNLNVKSIDWFSCRMYILFWICNFRNLI